MERTICWSDEKQAIRMIDQTQLPREYTFYYAQTVEELVESIKILRVRGAPALGAAGALGVALAAQNLEESGRKEMLEALKTTAEKVAAARPTAVNLRWGVNQVLEEVYQVEGKKNFAPVALAKAKEIVEADIHTNRRLGENGAGLLEPGQTVMTHCNAGALATVGWGTALGVIYSAVEAGKELEVFVNETRPLNQGARITTVELAHHGVPYRLIPDNASGLSLQQNEVDAVIVGADRIVFTGGEQFGDQAVVFNKIGTYKHAVLAERHDVDFIVAAPVSTFDREHSAPEVEIEERPAAELREIYGQPNAPADAPVYNPAFDATPAELVDYFVTESGVYTPPLVPDEIL